MTALQTLILRFPVIAYVALCYAISWSVWFAIPLLTPGSWTVVKILVGVGLGPGLAAVLLDRARGTGGPVDGRWWARFSIVFAAVAALDVSSLLTGDGISAEEFLAAAPVGIGPAAVAGTVLSSAACGFIFASAAASRSLSLRSIVAWRARPRWWLIALFLPAALQIVSYPVAPFIGDELAWPRPEGLDYSAWAGYVARSILFTLLVVGIGEEPGWRGWMLPELLKRYSPLRSSIILGVVWGAWHFPLFVVGAYPGDPIDVTAYLVLGPLLAILFTWLWLRTGENLLLVIVLHAAINNTPRALPSTGGSMVLLVALILGLVFVERMWRRRSEARVTTALP